MHMPSTNALPSHGQKNVPRWNLHKYFTGRDGYNAEMFSETVEPMNSRVETAVARWLAAQTYRLKSSTAINWFE